MSNRGNLTQLARSFAKLCRSGQHFACFGSRETPEPVLDLMRRLGAVIGINGGFVRSGHCHGADLAFESGVGEVAPEQMVVCLPWKKYNSNIPKPPGCQTICLDDLSNARQVKLAEEAKQYHKAWHKLSQGGRRLMSRNMLIAENAVAGFCYLNHNKPGGGGSGQCFRYLTAKNLPVSDLSQPVVFEAWSVVIEQLGF